MSKDPVLADYIDRLATLPECPAFVLYSASESEIIHVARYSYKAVSLWLRHLLLGEKLLDEAVLTDAKYYQPLAEIAKAEFNLAVGLHPRTANRLLRTFDAPSDLWFHCKWIQSQLSLKDAGLLINKPSILGKRQSTNAATKQFNQFAELSFPYREDTANDEPHRLIEIFHGEAQKLAKDYTTNFQVDYWNPYVRTIKRCLRQIERCEALQNMFLLPDGQISWTRKDKKLPSVRKKRQKNESF